MGRYTTVVTTDQEYKEVIKCLREGYITVDGHKHKPNNQIATILVLECNLGCRLSDIVALRTDSIKLENDIYKLNIIEQKTKKKRTFIVPDQIVDYINKYVEENKIQERRIFTLSEQAIWKALRQVTSHLGLKDVSSHSFRKAAAMALYEKSDYDVALVSQWLQHSAITTTSTYLKRNSKQMEQAIKGIVNLA